MGASLSLMAIVDEREIFDHERLPFLKIAPYIAAKVGILWPLAFFQTAVFLLLIDLLRSTVIRADASFFGLGYCLACLTPITWAATGLGLVISAAANRNKPLANFVLPLVMIAQIVFTFT